MSYSAVLGTLAIYFGGGIVDGEGCIAIARARPSLHNPVGTWRPNICVSMTDKGPIELFKQTFGGCISVNRPRHMNYRDLHVWSVSSNKAVAVALALMPWLRVKREQAELCVKLQTLKRKGGGNVRQNPLTQAEIDERHALWIVCSRLNFRGKQRKLITDWPKATPRRPVPLKTVCTQGHVNEFVRHSFTDSKTGKKRVKRLCRLCANERARKYRLVNREITIISRKTA